MLTTLLVLLSTTHNLPSVLALSSKEITEKAITLLQQIAVIRGNSATDTDQVKLRSKGISILRAKLKKSRRVLYLERNEVHLPAELLQRSGTVQVGNCLYY